MKIETAETTLSFPYHRQLKQPSLSPTTDSQSLALESSPRKKKENEKNGFELSHQFQKNKVG